MSILSAQCDELRSMANKLGFNGVSTGDISKLVPMLREAADTIESLRDRLQADALGSGTCEWLPVESCHSFAGPGWECSSCGHEVGEYEHDFYNCCPMCGRDLSGKVEK